MSKLHEIHTLVTLNLEVSFLKASPQPSGFALRLMPNNFFCSGCPAVNDAFCSLELTDFFAFFFSQHSGTDFNQTPWLFGVWLISLLAKCCRWQMRKPQIASIPVLVLRRLYLKQTHIHDYFSVCSVHKREMSLDLLLNIMPKQFFWSHNILLCFDNAVDWEGEIPLYMVLKEILILSWESNIPIMWLLPVSKYNLFCQDL